MVKQIFLRRLSVFASLVFLPFLSSCSTGTGGTIDRDPPRDFTVGTKSAVEVFGDTDLAELATRACHGDVPGMRAAVARSADPNAVGYMGASPLSWAIACRNVAGVEELLKMGADPNYQVGGSYSAVYQAATYAENPEILAVILHYGGDPNASRSDGLYTALYEALKFGGRTQRWENWYRLLDSGADTSGVGGEQVILIAIVDGELGRIGEILDRGFNGDLATVSGFLQAVSYPPDAEELIRERDELVRRIDDMMQDRPPGPD